MKKLTINLLIILFTISGFSNMVLAQAPEGIIYQAEARDSKDNLIINKALDVNITIIQDNLTGSVVFNEIHNVTTNSFGMFTLVIGQGTNTSGNLLNNVDWGNHSHFLNVQVKEPKKVWIDMGTSQLLSVPYALYATTAEQIKGGIIENDPIFISSQASRITSSDITKLSNLSGTNTGDQDLTGLATTTSLNLKVDKIAGKGLSTNDYTTAEQTKLAAITGTNTGDQDLSGLATIANLTTGLDSKVDKEAGKGLSTEDFTTAEKTKVSNLSGINSGDQDVSAMTHINRLALDAVTGVNTGDQILPTLESLGGVARNAQIIGSTKTKITYDTKGLVIAGADATTDDIAASTDKNYVTDAEKIKIAALPTGTALGQMQYWNGTAWVTVAPGTSGQNLTFCNGVPAWGPCPFFTLSVSKNGMGTGTIISSPGGINCGDDCTEPYILGTVVTLTALPVSGSTFAGWSGGGCSGTGPCTVNMNNAVTITAAFTSSTISTVTNPITGKTWMDRNLGASQVATSSTDDQAYGDLYQWGRLADGHQLRTSGKTITLSTTDVPGHSNFITPVSYPYNWRSEQNNNLWQGISGINNPCPAGYRLPTLAEWDAERTSWTTNDAAGAFGSPLKLPLAGRRGDQSNFLNVGDDGYYWSSTAVYAQPNNLFFNGDNAYMSGHYQANGYCVRCIMDDSSTSGSIGTLDCSGATLNGTLTANQAVSGVSTIVSYTDGNGGIYSGQTVISSGVTGLTATLPAGSFANGAGTLTYSITGSPSSAGTATFGLNIGGQTCNLSLTVGSGILAIGQNYQGGIIAYLFQPGDSEYVAGETHGLIAAPSDQSPSLWGCYNLSVPGTSTAIGTGQANTTIILNSCALPNIAARVCNDLVLNGYDDWFLPSKDELNLMFQQKTLIGGFVIAYDANYWSSSEYDTYSANLQNFEHGGQGFTNKCGYNFFVRAVRYITNDNSTAGAIGTLDCSGSTINGTLTANQAVSGVSAMVSYTGSNGGAHSGQTVTSTGVTGLTATLPAGSFTSGSGTLTYDITGTPSNSGTASFALNIGGQSCNLSLTVGSGNNSTAGLLAYYPFNGNANDESGNGNNGIVHGATLTTDRNGITNSAYYFDGTNNYIRIPQINWPALGTGDFTACAWVNISSFNDYRMIFADDILGNFQFNITNGGGSFEFYFPGFGYRSDSYEFTISNWYHLTALRQNGILKFYINGLQFGSYNRSDAISKSSFLDIGYRTSNNAHPFYGSIDDIRIYNRALTESEIQQLYNE